MNKRLGAAVLSLPILFYGCNGPSRDVDKKDTFEGYKVHVIRDYDKNKDYGRREIFIKDKKSSIHAVDSDYSRNNERFDELTIYAPKGDKIEKFMNLEKLEEAYKAVAERDGKK